MMIPIPPLSMLVNTITTRSFLVVLLPVIAVIAVSVSGIKEANRGQDAYGRALNLWLSECGKPIEACAYDWDRSSTLRSVYFARAIQPGEQQ